MTSCIVLAGGKSERMGRDKKLLEFKGKPLLHHVLEAVGEFSEEIILSLAREEELPLGGLSVSRIAVDEVQDKGPIGGVLSGLRQCSNDYAVVVPCDSPFLEPEVYRYMLGEAPGHDAVVPKKGGRLEPLHAVYKVQPMVEACEAAIKEGSLEMREVITRLGEVKYIPVEVFKKYDEGLLTFCNVNDPRDLKLLERLNDEGQGR